jgi:hypothetical protein
MLALKLHKTVQEAQSLMTSSEFVDWLTFLKIEREEENTHPTRDHHYFARVSLILTGIYNLLIQKKVELKLDDFLIKFESAGDPKALTEEQQKHLEQENLIKSKSAWGGFLSRFMKK